MPFSNRLRFTKQQVSTSLIGGCSGTQYGCCRNSNIASNMLGTNCPNNNNNIIFPGSLQFPGRLQTICCGGQPKICNAGTRGCFNGSTTGVCSKPISECKKNNLEIENLFIKDSQNNIYDGECVVDGNNLVCTYKNYC
jgi:hypothetical protein